MDLNFVSYCELASQSGYGTRALIHGGGLRHDICASAFLEWHNSRFFGNAEKFYVRPANDGLHHGSIGEDLEVNPAMFPFAKIEENVSGSNLSHHVCVDARPHPKIFTKSAESLCNLNPRRQLFKANFLILGWYRERVCGRRKSHHERRYNREDEQSRHRFHFFLPLVFDFSSTSVSFPTVLAESTICQAFPSAVIVRWTAVFLGHTNAPSAT